MRAGYDELSYFRGRLNNTPLLNYWGCFFLLLGGLYHLNGMCKCASTWDMLMMGETKKNQAILRIQWIGDFGSNHIRKARVPPKLCRNYDKATGIHQSEAQFVSCGSPFRIDFR